MSFKTASQYVRDRLGIGFEVVDLRLDQALGEIKRGDSMLRLSTLQIFFGKNCSSFEPINMQVT
jgi:hypothetical protein